MARNPDWTRDELILALDLYIRSGRRQLPNTHQDVIALSEALNELPIHEPSKRDATFRNPQGVSMKLANFRAVDPDNLQLGLPRGSKLDKEVWDEFYDDQKRLEITAASIREVASHSAGKPIVPPNSYDDDEFIEGRLLTGIHILRERSSTLVRRKKQRVLECFGTLSCEVCGFDFHKTYGQLGQGYAECHHLIPLSELGTTVRNSIKDLAIVCSNCHRMLHKSKPVLSVAELRCKIKK